MDNNKMKKRKDMKISSIYNRGLLSRTIVLPMDMIGSNIKETLETYISFNFEGKCMIEGFVKSNSTKIITFSSGELIRGNNIKFTVSFECQICFPVEGMLISCVAKNITKAGIRAVSADEDPSPIVVFIAQDHNYMNQSFNNIKVDDKLLVKVIGQRFELNDSYVSIIGELSNVNLFKEKPKIVIEDV